MSERKNFVLRISNDLYGEVEAWAQQELRSVNAQIEFILRTAVEKRRGKPLRSKEVQQEDSEEAEKKE
ncbi:MAG: hypothetical protein WC712_02150 [Candidatus Brocadiia bacterium]